MFGATNTPQFFNPGATTLNMTLNASGEVQALNGFGEITIVSGARQILAPRNLRSRVRNRFSAKRRKA